MNICILSNKGELLDEGQRNIAFHLSNEFSKSHIVYHVNAKASIFSKTFWGALKRFKPDIVHIFLRPYIRVLLFAKLLKKLNRKSKVVISALQPPSNKDFKKYIMPLLRPDLTITLSENTKRMFESLGYKTSIFNCGVDIEKFVPVTHELKLALREKYGIDNNTFVILHIGSITAGRNLFDLVKLQNSNNQVLIVTNTTFEPDQEVYNYLKANGCIIFLKYFDHIEEIYQLADFYLFPTLNPSNCIELPLSILEAMSCNLPVITTKFGALPRVFTNGEGLFFVDNMEVAPLILTEIQNKTIAIKTREKVIGLTWEKAAIELERIYLSLLEIK